MLWNLGKEKPKLSYVHERCPIAHSFDDAGEGFRTTETTDGHFCRVYELEGVDYTGMDDEGIENKFNSRRKFVESISQGLLPTIYTYRYKLSKTLNLDDHGNNDISNKIAHTWAETFSSTYRNRHFALFRTMSAGVLDRFVDQARGGGESKEARMARLDDLNDRITVDLSEFSPHLLCGDGLASFWAMLLNAETGKVKMPSDGIYDDYLSSCDLFWPNDKKNIQVYEGNNDRYSTWITLKIFDDEGSDSGIKPTVFKELYELKQEFLLAQSFDLMPKEKALKRVGNLKNRLESREDDSIDLKIQQLELLQEEIQADKIKLCNYRFSLQLFADSEKELNTAVAQVNKVINSHGFKSKRERLMSEALFWSLFPPFEKELHPRNREVTTENVAAHINFSSIGEGLNSCSWGPMPVMPLKTETGSEYSFCFHSSADSKALGNTLIVGGAGQGKTTLMQVLATHCRKYSGMRQIFLDQLRGMQIGITMQGGDYISFDNVPQLNPLQQKDTPANRQFLTNWFKTLSRKTDNQALETINSVIGKNFDLKPSDRNLDNLMNSFGLHEDGSIRDAMNKWFTGGAYEDFFTGKVDSLNFDKSMVGLDMTIINKSPEILEPIAQYLYHRVEQMVVEKPGPFIVWTDEYRNHIQSPILGPLQVNAKQQYRKLDGVCVDAVQDFSHVVGKLKEPNKVGVESIEQYAAFIFFPSQSADYDLLHEYCKISKEEHRWITDTSNFRKVLIKRKTGTSTILDVNLAALGNLLKAYSSDNDQVVKLRRLMETHPNSWKEEFLR
jgi:type IV secretion/conjugal transfer VirB4 family ATPase